MRSAEKKRRKARRNAHRARATPARCTTAKAIATPGDAPEKPAPYRSPMPSMVSTTWCGRVCAAASPDGSGRDVYPPTCLITLTTSSAAPNETMPAAIRENSSHREAGRLPSRTMAQRARTPQTTTSGAAASNTATRSEMMTQASIAAITTGKNQPVRALGTGSGGPGGRGGTGGIRGGGVWGDGLRFRPPVPVPGTVEHDEDDQQGHLGAEVVRLRDQQVNAVIEFRGEQDPGRYQRADYAFASVSPPLGQQAGQQHEQRVGGGARHMYHVRA